MCHGNIDHRLLIQEHERRLKGVRLDARPATAPRDQPASAPSPQAGLAGLVARLRDALVPGRGAPSS